MTPPKQPLTVGRIELAPRTPVDESIDMSKVRVDEVVDKRCQNCGHYTTKYGCRRDALCNLYDKWIPMPVIIDHGPRWPGETTVEKVVKVLEDEGLIHQAVMNSTYILDGTGVRLGRNLINTYRAAVIKKLKEDK